MTCPACGAEHCRRVTCGGAVASGGMRGVTSPRVPLWLSLAARPGWRGWTRRSRRALDRDCTDGPEPQ